MEEKLDISVVVPLLNEEGSLPELTTWIHRVMEKHSYAYELIFIDDGSTDNSWEVIQDLTKKYTAIKALRFNRNYGKSAALQTGFETAIGDVVITMDADLQDSPDEIPELYEMIISQELDLVSGWKKVRHDPIGKTLPSKLFNSVTRNISGIKLHDFNCGLKAYKNSVVKNIKVYGEMHRYIPVLAKWQGFSNIGEKIVEHRARKYGTTKFGMKRLLTGFLDLLSVTFVSKFRRKPMHFFGAFGMLSFLFGTIITISIIGIKLYKLYYHLPLRPITAQPLFYIALVAVIIGVQLFLAGFIAEMFVTIAHKEERYLIIDKTGEK